MTCSLCKKPNICNNGVWKYCKDHAKIVKQMYVGETLAEYLTRKENWLKRKKWNSQKKQLNF
jgi:hypothetical protein